MAKKKKSKERAYARLTRHERNTIERMLDRSKSAREIARELDRAPSTITNEIKRHRFVTSPISHQGEPAPDTSILAQVCPYLQIWPHCCNGCIKRRGYGCNRRPHIFYSARRAQRSADECLSASRCGIDETEATTQVKLTTIRTCLKRGLSPEQIAKTHPELALSASTIYRWVAQGYAEMTNLDLRRKVGYKPRRKVVQHTSKASHHPKRAYDRFSELAEDMRLGAWEMDTVKGCVKDIVCLLTLYHRPTSFQLVIPIADCTSSAVLAALSSIRKVLGLDGMRRMFCLVLTDRGSEFSWDAKIAECIGEMQDECRLYYCDARRADQKAGCEKNHVELRKLLPKGSSIRFDRLTPRDASLIMSQLNSEPRGKLGFRAPTEMFQAVFGDDAEKLLDAFGVELLGVSELNLTPKCIELARHIRKEASLTD